MPEEYKIEDLPVINVKEQAFDYGILKQNIPSCITNNLRYDLFDWQKEALGKLILFQAVEKIKNSKEPTHLMFNMATGTGKTLLMAAAILYYYTQGYRHFLFFVNRNNIVDKTENNFIDSAHSKYLFTEKIVIDDMTVNIKKTDTFSDNPQGIEIKFTSIQKLYNDIHLQRENQTTLDDLHGKNIVMLADEAHHLNADTKNKNNQQEFTMPTKITAGAKKAEIERRGWEHTVIDVILKKNNTRAHNENVLLEFTATIPATSAIVKKYDGKIMYTFGLKKFLQAGYTKEINLISSTLAKKERILQALLFQWYRHKMAVKYGIANFKPVILFRSKTIEESKADYAEFLLWVDRIGGNDLTFLRTISEKIFENKTPELFETGKSRTERVLAFIETEGMSFGEIAHWIKHNYQERNVIITNSATNKTKSEKTTAETEQLLNSLEDRNNNIRAIFTVDRLTEGWDVLNLFDIVRLYQGQNTGGGRKSTPQATIREKQLIGRGVRYFPFAYGDKLKNKRKFDDNIGHELRVLEELYYYTYDEESRYISHLKAELRKDGYIRDDKIMKTFSLKPDFTKGNFYNEAKLWGNRQVENPHRRKKTLDHIEKRSFEYRVAEFELSEQKAIPGNYDVSPGLTLQKSEWRTHKKFFEEMEKHIFLKAVNVKAKQAHSLLQFEKLKEELEITSIDELQTDKLAGFRIQFMVSKKTGYNDISNSDKLAAIMKVLDYIVTELKNDIVPKIGSNFTAEDFKKRFSEPKTKIISEDKDSERLSEILTGENWYILDSFHGTLEEKKLVEFVRDTIGNLRDTYGEIYLLRNEDVYKIYDFEKGRGFQPDFILFLKTEKLYYQVLIESKGNQFMGDNGTFKAGKEGWKERFLDEISEKYGPEKIIRAENQNYRLIGLPFFNKDHNRGFQEKWNGYIFP